MAAVAEVNAAIRVLIVDDDPLVRAGLAMIIGGSPELSVVGEAACGAEVPAAVEACAPDVVLIGDGGGHFPTARRPIVGVDPVARFLLGLFTRASRYGQHLRAAPVLVDGVFRARGGAIAHPRIGSDG